MMKHHRITQKEGPVESTLNLKKLLGIRVLSSSGSIVGRVLQIRINPISMRLEGIMISRGIFKKRLYIGESYIKLLSNESFILNTDPYILLKGRKVLDADGKVIGRVKDIIRKEHTNEISGIIIRSFLRKDIPMDFSGIKKFGDSIILQQGSNVKKEYFWKKS